MAEIFPTAIPMTQPGVAVLHRRNDLDDERVSRMRLLDLSIGIVEDLRRVGAFDRSAEAYCAHYQICFPYRGLFVWHVGGDEVVGDPNQVVFVRGHEPFRMSGPLPHGYAELIVTPDPGVLEELALRTGRPLHQHPLFARRARRADPHLQCFRSRFLRWAARGVAYDPLEAEEVVVSLLRRALGDDRPSLARGRSSARLIRRTKQLLQERLAHRLLLADISREVGASAAYLTDLFTRVEGVSLHQYLTQLRLARALEELPHRDDLTGLALDVGFSSHSHFSFAFRRAFGWTPSRYREAVRRAARPSGGLETDRFRGSR